MVFVACMIFFISAVFSIILLDDFLKGRPTSEIYVNWHSPITMIGIGILSTAVYHGNPNLTIVVSLLIFVLTALGGLVLAILNMFKKDLPGWLIVINTVAGLIALCLLVFYLLYQKKDSTSIYAEQHRSSIIET